MKTCSKCKVSLPLDSFHNSKSAKDGKQHRCKECTRTINSDPEVKAIRRQAWKDFDARKAAENPNYRKNMRFKREYGITYADYERMLEEQEGKCPCGRSAPEGHGGQWLHVDHDHTTGKVRGLLCPNCNKVLGLVFDNPDTLVVLAAYLINHKED